MNSENDIIQESYSEAVFESIKHVNEYSQEFWYARDLQKALGYKEWRNFLNVISKAIDACNGSRNKASEHFVDVNKSSPMPNGGEIPITDIMLTRYACCLIVMNGDTKKDIIALGQT